MIEGLASFVGAIKQAGPWVAFAIALAAGTVIFAPDSFVTSLGLIEFRDTQRALLGGAFLLGAAVVVANIAQELSVLISDKYKKHRNTKKLHRYLADLTPDEKCYLLPYIEDEVNTQHFQVEDGIAAGLMNKGIIYRPSNMFDMLEGPGYNIQPWAKERLKANPKLLEGAAKPKRKRNERI